MKKAAVFNTEVLYMSKHLTPDGSHDKNALPQTIAIVISMFVAMIDANFFSSASAEIFAKQYCALDWG
jgi:hypothetical protein